MSRQVMSARAVLIEELLARAIYHWRRGSARRGSRQCWLARHYVDLAVELHRARAEEENRLTVLLNDHVAPDGVHRE
jgi:hypothetical protein